MSANPPEGQQPKPENQNDPQAQNPQPGSPAGQPGDAPQFNPGPPADQGGFPGQPQAPQGAGQPQGAPGQQPQGSDGQPPAGWGQPGQPQGPGGQQPGGYPPAGGFQPTEEPKKAGGWRNRLISLGFALVVLVGVILWRAGVFDSPVMKVGDCAQREGSDSVKVVACGTPEAEYQVLGIVEDQPRSGGEAACAPWPDSTTIYWEGRRSSNGTVYCMKTV